MCYFLVPALRAHIWHFRWIFSFCRVVWIIGSVCPMTSHCASVHQKWPDRFLAFHFNKRFTVIKAKVLELESPKARQKDCLLIEGLFAKVAKSHKIQMPDKYLSFSRNPKNTVVLKIGHFWLFQSALHLINDHYSNRQISLLFLFWGQLLGWGEMFVCERDNLTHSSSRPELSSNILFIHGVIGSGRQ